MAEQRAWWGAGLVLGGLGTALLLGAGVAVAESDSSGDSGSAGRSAADDSSASAQSPAGGDSESGDVDSATGPSASRIGTGPTVALQQEDREPTDDAEDDGAPAEDNAADEGTADEDNAADEDAADEGTAAEDDIAPRGDGDRVRQAATDVADDAVASTATRSTVSAPPADDGTGVDAAAEASVSEDPRPVEPAAAALAGSDTVTGVKTGHAKLTIPLNDGYTTKADWYFPTQGDGSVSADGVIWLQHGFLNRKSFVSALAETLSQQTNSIVVAPNVASFPWRCAQCWLNGAELQQAVSTMFVGERTQLNASATAAGYLGELPQSFVLSGQSAGGGFATAVGGYYASDPGDDGSLRGVVMFDGFAFGGVLTEALQSLDDPYIPVYQVAAPPQLWNLFGATTTELVDARPGQFVGATLANGSHADAILGGNPIIDLLAQLVTKFSPPGNTAATHTLSTGWINDMYQGLGPIDGNGIYGLPDQYIVMGDTAAVVLGPPPVVDVDRYLGTWYEVGSVKQFFSIGLVNTKAVYSLNADETIKVENSGNYFFNNGPESSIVGVAVPVDSTNNKLNVSFFGPASDHPPGNYWIVDLSPDYDGPNGWAIVSDPTGFSGFLLSRSAIVSDELYQELLNRASVKGVWGWITRTRQPGAMEAVAA